MRMCLSLSMFPVEHTLSFSLFYLLFSYSIAIYPSLAQLLPPYFSVCHLLAMWIPRSLSLSPFASYFPLFLYSFLPSLLCLISFLFAAFSPFHSSLFAPLFSSPSLSYYSLSFILLFYASFLVLDQYNSILFIPCLL